MELEYCPPEIITSVGAFRSHYSFGPKDNQRYFDQVVKSAIKGQTAIHRLKDNNTKYGFIALSVGCFKGRNTKKCLNIDYLFVSEPYRKEKLLVEKMRLPEYLLSTAINLGYQLSQIVPIDLIGAEPSHESIQTLYIQSGFEVLNGYNREVLYLKL